MVVVPLRIRDMRRMGIVPRESSEFGLSENGRNRRKSSHGSTTEVTFFCDRWFGKCDPRIPSFVPELGWRFRSLILEMNTKPEVPKYFGYLGNENV